MVREVRGRDEKLGGRTPRGERDENEENKKKGKKVSNKEKMGKKFSQW